MKNCLLNHLILVMARIRSPNWKKSLVYSFPRYNFIAYIRSESSREFYTAIFFIFFKSNDLP